MPVSTSISSQQACTPLVKANGYSLVMKWRVCINSRGRSGGSANTVTPPINMPVSSLVSSADANDTLDAPSNARTA